MINYKGILIPGDIPFIVKTIIKILYTINTVSKKSSEDMIEYINIDIKIKNNSEIKQLIKLYRLSTFILNKIIHSKNPCLIRSYIIYKEALTMSLNSKIYIGVKKIDNILIGHSWVEINNIPFMENLDSIKEYTVMMKG